MFVAVNNHGLNRILRITKKGGILVVDLINSNLILVARDRATY